MLWIGPLASSTLAVLVTWLWLQRFKNASGSGRRIIYFSSSRNTDGACDEGGARHIRDRCTKSQVVA